MGQKRRWVLAGALAAAAIGFVIHRDYARRAKQVHVVERNAALATISPFIPLNYTSTDWYVLEGSDSLATIEARLPTTSLSKRDSASILLIGRVRPGYEKRFQEMRGTPVAIQLQVAVGGERRPTLQLVRRIPRNVVPSGFPSLRPQGGHLFCADAIYGTIAVGAVCLKLIGAAPQPVRLTLIRYG